MEKTIGSKSGKKVAANLERVLDKTVYDNRLIRPFEVYGYVESIAQYQAEKRRVYRLQGLLNKSTSYLEREEFKTEIDRANEGLDSLKLVKDDLEKIVNCFDEKTPEHIYNKKIYDRIMYYVRLRRPHYEDFADEIKDCQDEKFDFKMHVKSIKSKIGKGIQKATIPLASGTVATSVTTALGLPLEYSAPIGLGIAAGVFILKEMYYFAAYSKKGKTYERVKIRGLNKSIRDLRESERNDLSFFEQNIYEDSRSLYSDYKRSKKEQLENAQEPQQASPEGSKDKKGSGDVERLAKTVEKVNKPCKEMDMPDYPTPRQRYEQHRKLRDELNKKHEEENKRLFGSADPEFFE
ncbi:MAG: hypothetical protein PHC66_01120 [Candidatus Nanoarchaeia archaeon]|nr:hypothetical protein [Candidatus Nanoarchaeia archaeon]MDD5239095.1 hypothetical protein [Candidatus Nanoarchaeia archaeon]